MTTAAAELLRQLAELGAVVEPRGDRLAIRFREERRPEVERLRPEVTRLKPELLKELVQPQGKCPGPEKCAGCYLIPGGGHLHPPKVSQEWTEWLKKWEPEGTGIQ